MDRYRRDELADESGYVERAREAESEIAALERWVGPLTRARLYLDPLEILGSRNDGRKEEID